MAVEELPPQSPYGIESAYQDGGLKTASAGDSGPYEGRIVVCEGVGGKGIVSYGGGKATKWTTPSQAGYVWRRVS